jgi:hypothetical protein
VIIRPNGDVQAIKVNLQGSFGLQAGRNSRKRLQAPN